MYISQVIPARVAIKAAVVHMPKQTELVRCPLDDVSGFDLSRFYMYVCRYIYYIHIYIYICEYMI